MSQYTKSQAKNLYIDLQKFKLKIFYILIFKFLAKNKLINFYNRIFNINLYIIFVIYNILISIILFDIYKNFSYFNIQKNLKRKIDIKIAK